jgi:glycosyltransferase involved in cell wall biosynthesis
MTTTIASAHVDTPSVIRHLHLLPSLDPANGGTTEGVRQLSDAAVRLGHIVEIATLDGPGSAWGNECSYPVHNLGPGQFGKYAYSPRLRHWLRSNAARFDAVIVNGMWQYHGFAARAELQATKTPYFVFTHGMLDPWFNRQYPIKHLKKFLYWSWAEYKILRDANAVLFTCEEERQLARQSFRHYSANEAVVSFGTLGPTGDASAQREAFLQRFPHLRNRRILLFLGRIHPKKGCDLLLESFAAVARVDESLHLVMAGPDSSNLRRSYESIKGLDDTKVTWTGLLAGEQKWGAFRCAEAFVLPSHQENFGIATAEALACRVPVLISNKVNIWREIVTDGAGLAADDTLEGTTGLLLRWNSITSTQREVFSALAGECFRKRFHIDSAARNLMSTIAKEISSMQHSTIYE